MTIYPYRFEGPIEHYAFETYAYTVIYLPHELSARPQLAGKQRLRIVGEVADHPVAGAWQPAGGDRRYFILSKRFLKEAGIAAGDVVEMRFALDDPNAVTIPKAILDACKRQELFQKAWGELTPGAQRAFSHRVSTAKTAPTEQRRLDEVIEMVLSGEKPGMKRKKR